MSDFKQTRHSEDLNQAYMYRWGMNVGLAKF